MIKINKTICYHHKDNNEFDTFNVIDELFFGLKDSDEYSFTILDDDKEIAIIDVAQYRTNKNEILLSKEDNSNLYQFNIYYNSNDIINIKNKIYYFSNSNEMFGLNNEYYIMPYIEASNGCYSFNNEVVSMCRILILKKVKTN